MCIYMARVFGLEFSLVFVREIVTCHDSAGLKMETEGLQTEKEVG